MNPDSRNCPPSPGKVPPARRTRRVVTGLSLLGFGALLVPQALVDPSGPGFHDAAVHHPDALLISGLLLLASALLTFPAIGGILHEARDRGALMADIAALFAGLGALGHAAIGAITLVLRALAGGDPAQMRAVEERFIADVPVGVVGLVLLTSFGIGIALLAWAAWRAGILGLWGPVVVTGVVVAHTVLPGDLPPAVPALALGLVTTVFGWLGVRVVRLSDGAWDGPPSGSAPATSRGAATVQP